MSQIVLQPDESPDLVEPAGEQNPIGSTPSRELLTAWLLLLLDRQATHGYELRRLLEAHGVTADPGTLYRTLHRLESEGSAESTWGESAGGPRRRLYRLTTHGRRQLEELVGAIRITRDVHAAFLQAHKSAIQ